MDDSDSGSVHTAAHYPNIFQRINMVMRDVRSVDRSAKHQKGFSYSGHDAVTDAIRDAMVTYGIVSYPTVTKRERSPDGSALCLDVDVFYVNVEDPDDRFVVSVVGESFSMAKDRASGHPIGESVQAGIALSYAQKCADLKVFRLVGDKTPDAEKEKGQETPTAAQKPDLTEAEMEALLRGLEAATDAAGLTIARANGSEFAKTRNISAEQMATLSKATLAAVNRIGK